MFIIIVNKQFKELNYQKTAFILTNQNMNLFNMFKLWINSLIVYLSKSARYDWSI